MAANKNSVGRTLLVAFLLCLVCAVVVSTAAVLLRPVQQANKTLDRRVNILQIAGLYHKGMDVDKAFQSITRKYVRLRTGEYVHMPRDYDQLKAAKNPKRNIDLTSRQDIARIKTQAKVAEVYLVHDNSGKLTGIVIPIRGYGLWSTLYGYMALKPDAETITGLGFYQEGETPGLGGRVDDPSWKALWHGKKLYNKDGDVAIRVIKGTVDANTANPQYKVDGLAGATLTSNGVNNLVRFWVGQYGFGPYLKRMRENYEHGDLKVVPDQSGGEA